MDWKWELRILHPSLKYSNTNESPSKSIIKYIYVRGLENSIFENKQQRYKYRHLGKKEYLVKWVGYNSSQNTW